MNFVNLDGKISAIADAALPVDNGSFRYGYGLFETILVQQGELFLDSYHWERLFAGMEQLYFRLPALFTPGMLREELLRTVRKNNAEALCRARVQVFAGGGGLYGIDARPHYIIECFPVEHEVALNENGLVIGIAEGLSKSIDSLSSLKSCNALIYAIAARQARSRKWNDILICNTHGNIIESSIANIFWIRDGSVFTPPLSEGCVAGVMRRYILERLPAVSERPLHINELLAADEVFLTNAVRKVSFVGSLNGVTYSNKTIQKLYTSL